MAAAPDPLQSFLHSISSSFKSSIASHLDQHKKVEIFALQMFVKMPKRVLLPKIDQLKADFDGFISTAMFARVGVGLEEKEESKSSKLSVSTTPESVESEGRQLIEELDRDGDGQVTLEDLETAMRKRKLPKRSNRVEAPTVVPVSRHTESATESVLKSALAGGLACSFSAFVMHPIDTMKTCVQASTLSFPELVRTLPQIGLRGLFKGSIPAVLGQFSSHGLRTGFCEASKLILKQAVPTLPEVQVQSLASFCSTILGTTSRLPCEVLKQRLQAGIYDNVGEAFVCILHQDGIRGFFRGTAATLCREVPFYVAGMGLYDEAKKAMRSILRRDLEPWETVVVGAVTGGLASVLTTPFDVVKTRMMVAPQGVEMSMRVVAFAILREEGPLALFRGAVSRFFWVAPLGAMNFAGYELLRKAMDRDERINGETM